MPRLGNRRICAEGGEGEGWRKRDKAPPSGHRSTDVVYCVSGRHKAPRERDPQKRNMPAPPLPTTWHTPPRPKARRPAPSVGRDPCKTVRRAHGFGLRLKGMNNHKREQTNHWAASQKGLVRLRLAPLSECKKSKYISRKKLARAAEP